MIKKTIILLATVLMIFSFATVNALAKGGNAPAGAGQMKKSKPFLITKGLPHMTMQLMQQWDNPRLNLSEGQKEKLMKVRQDTMSGAKRLGREITPLEQEVIDGIFSGKTAEELKPVVDRIADLKAQATVIHLRCIYDTSSILSREQLELLKTVTAR